MLLQIIFKQLMYLIGQSSILLNNFMTGSDLAFDKVLIEIRNRAKLVHDGSGIVISCQLIRKALKGLGLVTRTRMHPDEKL